jgi:hypothetical protein
VRIARSTISDVLNKPQAAAKGAAAAKPEAAAGGAAKTGLMSQLFGKK